MSPGTHTQARTIPTTMNCAGMKVNEAPRVEFSCWRLWVMESCAHWCVAFHAMSGLARSNASAAPTASQRLQRSWRCGLTARLTTSAATRNNTLSLSRRATPVTTPIAIQNRRSQVRNMRLTNKVITDQKNTSNAVVDKRWNAASA